MQRNILTAISKIKTFLVKSVLEYNCSKAWPRSEAWALDEENTFQELTQLYEPTQ